MDGGWEVGKQGEGLDLLFVGMVGCNASAVAGVGA